MPTTSLPRGRRTRMRLAFEVTTDVNPGANAAELNPYTITITPVRPLQDDDVLGAGFANDVDSRAAAPSVQDPTWKADVPLDLGQVGYWLGATLGRVSATGNTTKTHVFTSGQAVIPTMSLEEEYVTAAQYDGLLGAAVTSLKIPFGPAAGYQMLSLAGIGCTYVEPYAATAMGTPTVEPLSSRVPKSVGILKIGGTQVGSVISGDVTISAVIDKDRYVGDADHVSLLALDSLSAQVTLSVRYNTDALRSQGVVGNGTIPTATAVEIDYSLGGNLSLGVLMPNVRWEPVAAPVANGKTITLSMVGRAEGNATAPMLTATLVNAHASY